MIIKLAQERQSVCVCVRERKRVGGNERYGARDRVAERAKKRKKDRLRYRECERERQTT